MGDKRYLTSELILDASPLIYLAKLEALDVLEVSTRQAFVTPAVIEEVTRPQLAYRHPDAVVVERAMAAGTLEATEPTAAEQGRAHDIATLVSGLHSAEAEVLAIAISRTIPAVIFERRARRVAASLGASLVDVTELLVAGTRDGSLLEDRVVRFARLVDLRLDDAVALLERVRARGAPAREEKEG
jgi:predicted nucleic acid-binding protein